MTYKNIILNKLVNDNNIDVSGIDVSLQIDDYKLYVISIFDKYNRMLYYQVYRYTQEYCGDCRLECTRNEFGDGKLFTNEELKIIFNIDCENVDDYCLEQLGF